MVSVALKTAKCGLQGLCGSIFAVMSRFLQNFLNIEKVESKLRKISEI